MADREDADLFLGHPGFASAADEARPRCPHDGGYFYSDGTCENCGRTLVEINRQEGA